MKEETMLLLSAAREVVKPRWPCPDAISYHLPAERNVSRTAVIIVWPGYRGRRDVHALLNFRRASGITPIEQSEFLEPMLDRNEVLQAARECTEFSQHLDRMAQAIRDQQKAEFRALIAEANALLLAGVDEPPGDFAPLFPVIHRMLTVYHACENGFVRPDAFRKLASDIIAGKTPGICVESMPQEYGQSVEFIITNIGEARLHLYAELRGGRAFASWFVAESKTVQYIAGPSYTANAIKVSKVCRTPHEAVVLIEHLDTIISALGANHGRPVG